MVAQRLLNADLGTNLFLWKYALKLNGEYILDASIGSSLLKVCNGIWTDVFFVDICMIAVIMSSLYADGRYAYATRTGRGELRRCVS